MTRSMTGNILTHMKTTIDIADDLLLRSKRLAKQCGITLRALIEEGLHDNLARREQRAPFRFRPVTVKGKGLSPEAEALGWEGIRQAIYRGRGT
jgi:hypothetical protein